MWSFRRLFVWAVFVSTCLFLSLHPGKFATRYPHIAQSELWSHLVKRTSAKNNSTSRWSSSCDYAPVLGDASFADLSAASEDYSLDAREVRLGGEHSPSDCRPLFSTAIVVPYRERDSQLRRFLTYMHAYLRRQRLHYRIYVVEQDDAKPFNRAKLLNVGARQAIAHGFPCLVLHDVDLLPLKLNNLYACTAAPRHMSCSVDKFRFKLPYASLFGGAVSMLSEQFISVNGMSNNYFGWGAEDDDLYQRLEAVGLEPCRLEPEVSSYFMMSHQRQSESPVKNDLLATARQRYTTDGLNSLKFKERSRKLHPLFTHILVAL